MGDFSSTTVFRGPGAVRELARKLDWSSTPLGPVAAWSQSLRSTVRTLLSSQYPMILTWGACFTQIYNDAYAGLIGNKHPGALGDDIRVTMEESWDTLGPMIARVMDSGVANWTPALPLLIERSGYREEAYFSVSHAPAEDDDGQIVGMLAVCSEVTSQVVGERRLNLLRELATAARDIRSVQASCQALAQALAGDLLDLPFALLYLRQGSLPSDLPGLPLERAVAVGLAEEHAAAPASLADGAASPWDVTLAMSGQAVQVSAPLTDLTGGLWADPVTQAVMLPVRGEVSNEPLGILILGLSPSRAWDDRYQAFCDLVADQISTALRNARAYEAERRRAEALAELDRAKTRFFSNVSHEFRTPLTLMLGPVEELLRRPGLDPEIRGELTLAHRNALRLLRLVNTLLDFSRVEAGRAEASFEAVDLPRLTAELASTFRSAIEKAGLRLVIDCPPLPADSYVDRDMWEKIVLNLLSNAFKHSFAGQIAVSLRAGPEGTAQLTVSDTGVRIPPDQIDRIFDRFHRVEGAQSRTHEGSGIGLALVRELVELHGGRVEARSRPGQGATFIVTIPLGRAHLPPERVGAPRRLHSTGIGAAPFVEEALRWVDDTAPTAPLVAGPAPLPRPAADRPATIMSRRRIVLADDNADMRAYVTRLLQPSYEVVPVVDGAAALAALRAQPANLLLTDIMMPVMDGLALLRAVRADPALRSVPVLLLSARAGEEASVEGLEAGADDYLVKPFSARELQVRVKTHLELAALRRETEAQAHQAQKMDAVGQLTGGIAHDFNNLLGAVIGSLELIELRVGDDPRVVRLLRNAQEAAQRGAKLTSQLLSFSRRQQLQPQPTDLNRAILGMGDLLHRSLGGKIGFEWQLAHDLWPALADANQFELAVLNLALNARDAMPDGGRLTIRTVNEPARDSGSPPYQQSGDCVVIEVSDTGHGMSREVLSHAFEPFFTTKDVGKGTGLGLAQVFGSVRQLRGDVTIESEEGIGTTVRMFFRRAESAAAAEQQLCGHDGGDNGGVRASILLVDDDPHVRVAASDMLAEMGHVVTVAENGLAL